MASHAVVSKVSEDFAAHKSMPTPKPEMNQIERMRNELEGAKLAGRRERLRVTVPCLVVALAAQLMMVFCYLYLYFAGKYLYFGQTIGMLAVPICMLALLPTDVYWTSVRFMRSS